MALLVPHSLAQYSGAEKFRSQWRQIDERAGQLEALDFQVLSHRDWTRLKQSHAKNVVVHWPDGRRTEGLDDHIVELKQLFVHAKTYASGLIAPSLDHVIGPVLLLTWQGHSRGQC